MDYEGTAVNYIAGTPYLGASVRMYPGPGGYQGELMAWDVAKAKKVWSIKEKDFPVYSGVLSTGGDLVFYGTMDGWFRAVDAHSGKVLWQFHTASGIVGNPDDVHRSGRQAVCCNLLGYWRLDGSRGLAFRLDRRSLRRIGRSGRYEEDQERDAAWRYSLCLQL